MNKPLVSSDNELYPDKETKPSELGNIKGKTLEVYYYLVDNPGEHGVRQIQRALDYNSSSIAAYHLNRLYEYDLVGKTEQGRYYIEGDPIKLGALEDHITVAGMLLPRTVVYGLQGLLTIFFGIILFIYKVDAIFWLLYIIIMNGILLVKVIKDSLDISSKLKIS